MGSEATADVQTHQTDGENSTDIHQELHRELKTWN